MPGHNFRASFKCLYYKSILNTFCDISLASTLVKRGFPCRHCSRAANFCIVPVLVDSINQKELSSAPLPLPSSSPPASHQQHWAP